MRVIIATIKSWNIDNYKKIKNKYSDIEWKLITNKEEFNLEVVKRFAPDYIFLPHWSWIISEQIYSSYNCIVFHMTDLPFGRGGSPLQNLIIRGLDTTKISAIQASGEIDAGDIYLKKDVSLNGTADEILKRVSDIIFNDMIPFIIHNDITPYKQEGEIVKFNRRKPFESEIPSDICDLISMYDYIRMLDGEGYPKAFIKYGEYTIKFSKSNFNGNKIIANVEISKDGGYE